MRDLRGHVCLLLLKLVSDCTIYFMRAAYIVNAAVVIYNLEDKLLTYRSSVSYMLT